MKNKLFLFGIVLLCFTSLDAQLVKPGVRAGLNVSNITDVYGDSSLDFYVGTYAAVKLAKWYTLQPEINYSRQGKKARGYFTDFDPVVSYIEEDWQLDYVGLAVNNKFYVVKGGHLMLAPFVDVLVNNKNVEPTNDVDAGINLGLGYTFKNGLGIEARYKVGFVDVFEEFSDSADDDYYFVNEVFQIGISYTFDLKK